MSDYKKDETPPVFIKATVYPYKSDPSRHYVWSKTLSLSEVIRELGTDVVTIKMTKSNKDDAKEDERTFVIQGSDPKYLPKRDSSQGGSGGNKSYSGNQGSGSSNKPSQKSDSNDDDIVL